AWAMGAVGTFTVLYRSIQANGHDPSEHWLTIAGLSLFCGLGVAPLGVGIPFLLLRALAPIPEFPLQHGETLVHEWVGNHFLGGESRGGRVLLTSARLGFRPHRFNVQSATWSVNRADITRVRVEGARFLLV